MGYAKKKKKKKETHAQGMIKKEKERIAHV
jgi:hypothetical protein